MSDKSNKINRRSFLNSGALFGLATLIPPPFEKLMNVMATGFIQQAQAAEINMLSCRNYVNLQMGGAPIRYCFDQWLRTNESEPGMIYNPMVATSLTNSNGMVNGTEYKTFKYRDFLVPHMFSGQVYNGRGELRPLTQLLDHMMVIRGYGSGMDGHPTNAVVQQAPLGGVSSIAGLAADYSTKEFQAIQWPNRGDFGSYNSAKGKSINKLVSDKPLNSLMEGFSPSHPDRLKATDLLRRQKNALELAESRLKTYIKSDNKGSKVLAANMSNATQLMKKGVGDIDGFWAEALPRYKRIIEQSSRMAGVTGLNDFQIPTSDTATYKTLTNGDPVPTLHIGDLRETIQSRNNSSQLAEGFALAEYVLKQGLSTSIEIACDFTLGSAEFQTSAGKKRLPIQADMHGTGAIAAIAMTVPFYRGLAAAILELSDQLKAVSLPSGADLWSETVFQLSAEFGRSARGDGSGSDHGFNQMVTSVYSGIIKQPIVIGNIRRTGSDANYSGTQGIAAKIDDYNQSGPPTPAMAASAVAALLRVPENPYQNVANALVVVENGAAMPRKTGKLVDT